MFKNLKSLFVIEEESSSSSKKTAPKQKPKSKATPVPKPAGKDVMVESKTGDPGKVTNKFLNVLFQALEQNNLEGFDYLEYKQSLDSLKKMPMDEATRFKSAFAMAQTMGATPAHLVNTAQHYIKILKQEEQKFEKALSNQRTVQIQQKDQEIKQMDQLIKAKEAQIQQLNQEIEKAKQKAAQLKEEVNSATQKVETTKNNFIASYNMLVSQIDQDVEKIKQHLK